MRTYERAFFSCSRLHPFLVLLWLTSGGLWLGYGLLQYWQNPGGPCNPGGPFLPGGPKKLKFNEIKKL